MLRVPVVDSVCLGGTYELPAAGVGKPSDGTVEPGIAVVVSEL